MSEPFPCGGDWCEGPCPHSTPCPGRAHERLDPRDAEIARLRAARLERQRPEGETAEQVAAWLRKRGWSVSPPVLSANEV